MKILRKLNVLLDKKQKTQMAGLVVLMLVGGVLESFGITMIVPIMQIVLDPEKTKSNGALSLIYKGLNMQSTAQFACFMMLMMILVFVIKNIFLESILILVLTKDRKDYILDKILATFIFFMEI